jgi:hypothetical protein
MCSKKINIKKGSALLSLAVVTGFIALLVFTISSSNDVFLGAQAVRVEGGGDSGRPSKGSASAPSQVTGLVATGGDGFVDISWDIPNNGGEVISSYSVRYSDRSGTQTIDTRSQNSSFRILSLVNDTSYTISVAAVNSIGVGPFSEPALAVPQAKIGEVSYPENLSAAGKDSQITLTWDSSVSRDVEAYELEIKQSRAAGKVSTIKLGNVLTHTISELVNGQEYEVRVRAISVNDILSDWSPAVLVTPIAGKSPLMSPEVISFEVDSEKNNLIFKWSDENNQVDSLIGYEIVYSVDGGREKVVEVDPVLRNFTIPDILKGAEYSIQIRSMGENNLRSDLTQVYTSVLTTIPSAPQNLKAIPGDGSISLSWDAPRDTGGMVIDNYIVAYVVDSGRPNQISVEGNNQSVIIEGLKNSSTYNFEVSALNRNGSSSNASRVSGVPMADVEPSIVGRVTAESFDTYAIVRWSTNRQTSTRVDFGLLTAKVSTPEYNTDRRVVNHEVTVTNLLPCTTYSYRVKSFDSKLREVIGGEESFTTRGCSVDSDVREIKRSSVETARGGSLDFTNTNVRTRLDVPANVKAEVLEDEIVFQVKKLEKDPVINQIGIPDEKKQWLGAHVYNFAAYRSETERVNDFDKPVTVSISYDRSDVENINLNTLSIYHYDPRVERWEILNNCKNSYDPRTGQGEISCQTNSFSVFGLFAEQSPSVMNSRSSSRVSTSVVSQNHTLALVSDSPDSVDGAVTYNESTQDQSPTLNELPDQDLRFPNNLWIGILSTDVIELQKFLNEQGFTVAVQGPGSPGFETPYFGQRTLQALKKFQTFYSDSILKPAGITQATGYFGLFTRMFVNQNF